MIEAPEQGGAFQYVSSVRDASRGEINFAGVQRILDGETPVRTLQVAPATLVLFRGRDALHRVTAVAGARTRVLAVLAYNTRPGIALSPSTRLTFYGRLG